MIHNAAMPEERAALWAHNITRGGIQIKMTSFQRFGAVRDNCVCTPLQNSMYESLRQHMPRSAIDLAEQTQ